MAKKTVTEEFPTKADIDPICVVMVKDGEEIPVHPDQIAQWEKHGWTVAE